MSRVWSGAIAYEFSDEDNKYGLVRIHGRNLSKLPDFYALKTGLHAAAAAATGAGPHSKVPRLQDSSYRPACPQQSDSWPAAQGAHSH
ncbi:hypothetical protein HK405_003254 [Cladochytrium tenue]|nr:hypothetical protein HK405_003254 [Cladochytrium tenue]